MNDLYNLTTEQNIFLAKKQLVGSIYSSAKVEGINITFPQTQTILDGITVANLKVDDVEKILNLRDAWKYVLNNIETELSLDFIKKINSFVARNESLDWGVLRYGSVGISGTDYIPPIPEEKIVLMDLFNILHSQNSVTEKALNLFMYLCKQQLFWDGNKRTAMIVVNKYLIENGKGIFQISEKNIEEFNTLLSEYYSTDEKDKLKNFLYHNCIQGITMKLKI